MAVFNWAAVAVGVVLALHHVAAAGVVYLILFYATFVGTSLEESFEFIRLISRAIGRCAKFAGIAATEPDIVDVPGAPDLVVPHGRVEFRGPAVRLPRRRPAVRGSGPAHRAGRARRPRRSLRFGQDDADEAAAALRRPRRRAHRDRRTGHRRASRSSRLRRHIAYVPQDPQMLHRTIAENICYGHGRSTHGGRHGPGARRRPRRLRRRVRASASPTGTRRSWGSAA